MTTIAALLTSHNRRETTLASLERLHDQRTDVEVATYLVDAGSDDGTADAVAARFPEVHVLRRGPELYWNAGMLAAWQAAVDGGHRTFLWLNDDTMLDPDAVARLVTVAAEIGEPAIVVGATRHPHEDRITYSGVRRTDPLRPMAFSRVEPSPDLPLPAETVNGNCVLVPGAVVDAIGLLDPAFTHAMGDFDYGLRARAAGFDVYVAPGTVGTCADHRGRSSASIRSEWAHLTGQKGLPPREWARFTRRHAGPMWPVYFASPYLRRLLRAARSPRR